MYVRFGSTWELRALFYGIGPIVVGVLVGTSYLVARSSLLDWFSIVVFAVAVTVLFAARKIPDQL